MKGFDHKKCVDFEEIFSPVVKMSSIRLIMGLVASLNLKTEQIDVKIAFLQGDLEKEIYMEQPEGFSVKGKEELVYKLKKNFYGLKQAPWSGTRSLILLYRIMVSVRLCTTIVFL